MTTYPFGFDHDHIIFEVDGKRVLLDTGAPATIADADDFVFLGEQRSPANNFLGLTVEQLSELVGARIDVLLGMDVIGAQPLTIDVESGRLGFGGQTPDGGVALDVSSVIGVPAITATVAGRDLRAYFDTGAKISFVPRDLVGGTPAVDRIEDFYPGFGRFETDLHRLPCSIGGLESNLDCGMLPDLLQTALGMTGVKGIIGHEVCRRWTVVLDMQQRELRLVG